MSRDEYREWSRQLWRLVCQRHEIMEKFFDKSLFGRDRMEGENHTADEYLEMAEVVEERIRLHKENKPAA